MLPGSFITGVAPMTAGQGERPDDRTGGTESLAFAVGGSATGLGHVVDTAGHVMEVEPIATAGPLVLAGRPWQLIATEAARILGHSDLDG